MALFPSTPTSPELLALLERARTYKMSPDEVFEQRVSFIAGQLMGEGRLTAEERDNMRRRVIESQGAPSIETLRRLGYA